jgi:hypothetical protein
MRQSVRTTPNREARTGGWVGGSDSSRGCRVQMASTRYRVCLTLPRTLQGREAGTCALAGRGGTGVGDSSVATWHSLARASMVEGKKW